MVKRGLNIPDGHVKRGNTVDFPFFAQPAPEDCVAVWPLAVLPDKDEGETGNERDAVAKEEVRNLHLPESSSVELVVKGEIHVDGHCQSPESIALHEAVVVANGVSDFISLQLKTQERVIEEQITSFFTFP